MKRNVGIFKAVFEWMNETLLSEKLIWKAPLWHERYNEPIINSCCICPSYICVSFSGLFNGLKNKLWLLDAVDKGKDFQWIWLSQGKVVGKVFKLLLERYFDEIVMKFSGGGGLQERVLRGSCPLNAGLHDVSIIFSLLLEGCLFKSQDLVWEDGFPYTSGFYTSQITVMPSPSVLTARTCQESCQTHSPLWWAALI